MSYRALRIAVCAVALGAFGAVSFAPATASAFDVQFSLENWAVSGSLTPKKLGEPVILPKGSTFNGTLDGSVRFGSRGAEVSGGLRGSIFVPPFKASLKLVGLIPTTVGVTFTEVGESEGVLEPSTGCSGARECETLGVIARANIGLTVVGLLGIEVPTQCETSEPVVLALSDTLPLDELVETSGPRFTGTTTIPSIKCGGLSGIALGLLLTELMSGPDNPYSLHIGPVEPAPPAVVTGAASAVSQISATLNATVDPNTEAVSDCHFEYGTSTSYGASVPCASLPGSGHQPVAVSAAIAGLSESATYHYRILATNVVGTSVGADHEFTTLSPSIAPEYGRCVAQKHGEYSDGNCDSKVANAKKGKFEWVPGPAPSCVAQKHGEYTDSSCTTKSMKARKGAFEKAPGPGYTSTTGTVTLTTTALGRTVVCAASAGAGDVTGLRTGVERVTFTGCESSGKKCTSEGPNATPSGKAGVIVTNLLHTRLLGPVSGKEVWTELASAEHEPYVYEFGCEGSRFRTAGSLAGVQTGDVNVSSLTSTTTFAIGQGEQALHFELSENAGASWVGPDPASEVAAASNTAASAIEIRP